jgi:hypothetical protein
MTDNQKAGNAQPWSEEQQEEYLRRYRLTAKKERIERIAMNILHGQATRGCTSVVQAFEDAERLVDKVDSIQ